MTNFVEELVRLVTPAGARPNEHYWPVVEAELGCEFPQDYKKFLGVYGAGQFDEFLWVYEPNFLVNPYMDLVGQAVSRMDDLESYRFEFGEDEGWPDGVSAASSLIAWGNTDNGTYLYWQPADSKGGVGRVLVNDARAPIWSAYSMEPVEFLFRLLSGEVAHEWFEGWIPRHPHLFEPGYLFPLLEE